MQTSIHLVRNVAVGLLALLGIVLVTGILGGGALAIAIGLLLLGVTAPALPFVSIHYEEHAERLRRSGPGSEMHL